VKDWPSRGWRMTVLLAAVLVGAAAACGLAANALSSDHLPLCGPATGGAVGHLSLDQAVSAHARGAVFVDARVERAFQAGHIADALSVPFGERDDALRDLRRRVPRGDPVVVYCTGPGCQAGARLAEWMAERGWRNVNLFDAGYPVWQAAGQPVETGGHTELHPR
jgi:rhodanese-related sulfurtransferase